MPGSIAASPCASPVLGGMIGALNSLWKNRLTVLAYHRVTAVDPERFDTYRTIVSATPEEFKRQMDFVSCRFSVISAQQLLDWLQCGRALPPAPLLITFDDGYSDNFEFAFPILRERRLTATIFVSSGFLDGTATFVWDLVAYCFHHTPRREAELPRLGLQRWAGRESREGVARAFLRILKQCPDDVKQELVSQLPGLLGVEVKEDAFRALRLTWEQARIMTRAGFEIGGHTTSHPILTRVPLATARREVAHAKLRIEAETGLPARLFAYTNGMAGDFNDDLERLVKECGFLLAFSLLPGPTSLRAVRSRPFAVRRILVSRKDTLPRFAAKVMGAARLAGTLP